MNRLLALPVLLFLPLLLAAQPVPDNSEGPANPAAGVGVTERLGESIPLDLIFTDETGRVIKLGDFITKPTLLLPIFYHCPMSCNIMLGELSAAVQKLPLQAGIDYRVLTVSFDPEDIPATAAERKENYLRSLGGGYPGQEWRFLVGDQPNIDRLLGALGYGVRKTGPHAFVHPNTLITIAPSGKIIRYIYGPAFLPFDIGMSITEAARETPGFTIRKVLSYCFSYDPQGKRYVLSTMRVVGLSILAALGLFAFFITRKPSGRQRRDS